jgi:hypothetical protein
MEPKYIQLALQLYTGSLPAVRSQYISKDHADPSVVAALSSSQRYSR